MIRILVYSKKEMATDGIILGIYCRYSAVASSYGHAYRDKIHWQKEKSHLCSQLIYYYWLVW